MGQGVRDESVDATGVASEHHFYHDLHGDASLTATLLSALAEVEGVDPDALPVTLHDYVDVDALERIVAPKLDGTPREGSRVEVTIPDLRITVHGDGHVVVAERFD